MQELKPAMTFDEVSMERSKNFVKALQELKNLRPQLYSAAEYCEKSYLHNEQKQMVLDNLKDYAVRALVNAIDHLGTVASKLNDLFEQQTFDVSTVDLKISCINQQVLTCEAYTDKEGLRQQQLSSLMPEYHKHYILPNSINKNQLSVMKETDMKQKHIQVKPRPHPSGTPMSKTLSWHLASETKSSLDGAPVGSNGIVELKASGTTSEVFHLLDAEKAVSSMSARQLQSSNGIPFVTKKNPSEANKALSQFRSFDQHGRREISHPPARSKSLLSSFFVKHKSAKLKMRQVS